MEGTVRHVSNRAIAVLALGVALGRPDGVRAQAFRTTAAEAAPKVERASAIDAEAMRALDRMGAYLRTLGTFQVRGDITTEEVLPDGQKVQLAKVADLVARKPDGLRLNVTSDREQRLFLYDGKTFTLYAPRSSFYASVAAPATISQLVDRLEDAYGIEMPFVDLFRWGTSASKSADITGATDIGPSVIDGVTCEHYAFRQDGLDWQVWIQAGDFPLPRKVVITTLTDEARPQHVAQYTWNLAPSVDSTAFTFAAPKDAKKITLAEVREQRTLSRAERKP